MKRILILLVSLLVVGFSPSQLLAADNNFCVRVDGKPFYFSTMWRCGFGPEGEKWDGTYYSFDSEAEARAYLDQLGESSLPSGNIVIAPTPPPAPFQASAMSDADKDKYLEVLRKGIDGESTLALAIDADGFWTWHSGATPFMAKSNALNHCKAHSKKRDTCKIVDMDGKSDFIKQRSSATSTGNILYQDDHKWCEALGLYTSQARCQEAGGQVFMWCATKYSVSRKYPSACADIGGKVFNTRLEADAEQKRRAGEAETAKATPTTLEESSANKEATDIEFWQSIKDDDNPDLFQAYLDQFPDGAYVSIAKIKINELRGDSQSPDDSSLTERLKTLKQLFESELISSEDYEAKKAELLKEL